MPAHLTRQIVVLRTGHLVYFEWAYNALKEAGIPFFTQEENAGGLRLAMPVAPSAQSGISWAVLVPEPAVPDAQEVLADLPFDIRTEAGIWDFQPTRRVKVGWKVYMIIMLVLTAFGFLLTIIHGLRLYR
jgi:hypothetical protein